METNEYRVTHTFQSEVEDTFTIYNKETHEVITEKFPRSMGLTCEDVMSYYA
jgi:hypothetical protein